MIIICILTRYATWIGYALPTIVITLTIAALWLMLLFLRKIKVDLIAITAIITANMIAITAITTTMIAIITSATNATANIDITDHSKSITIIWMKTSIFRRTGIRARSYKGSCARSKWSFHQNMCNAHCASRIPGASNQRWRNNLWPFTDIQTLAQSLSGRQLSLSISSSSSHSGFSRFQKHSAKLINVIYEDHWLVYKQDKSLILSLGARIHPWLGRRLCSEGRGQYSLCSALIREALKCFCFRNNS